MVQILKALEEVRQIQPQNVQNIQVARGLIILVNVQVLQTLQVVAIQQIRQQLVVKQLDAVGMDQPVNVQEFKG